MAGSRILISAIICLVCAACLLMVEANWARWVFGVPCAVIALNLLLCALVRFGRTIPIAEIRKDIEASMQWGLDGATLRISQLGSRHRVDFVKLIPSIGPTRFFMRLKAQRCSADEFDRSRQALLTRNLDVRSETDQDGNADCLIVECGQDTDSAVLALRAVFVGVFDVPWTEKVRVGASLAEPLEESGRFPHLLVQIISVGEQTGKLDELLLTAADTFDDDADAAIDRFMAIMPAVLVLMLAVVIGFIIVATILPIWSLQMSVGGF